MKLKLVTIILAISCFMLITYAYAEKVNPLKGVERSSPSNWSEDIKVWNISKIDRISKNMIVINDTSFKLSDYIRYYLENGSEIDKSSFKKGTVVIYVLTPGKRDTIVSLIKIEK